MVCSPVILPITPQAATGCHVWMSTEQMLQIRRSRGKERIGPMKIRAGNFWKALHACTLRADLLPKLGLTALMVVCCAAVRLPFATAATVGHVHLEMDTGAGLDLPGASAMACDDSEDSGCESSAADDDGDDGVRLAAEQIIDTGNSQGSDRGQGIRGEEWGAIWVVGEHICQSNC